jgi:hypothetical protein
MVWVWSAEPVVLIHRSLIIGSRQSRVASPAIFCWEEWTLLDPLSLSIDLDCTTRTVHARGPPLDCSHRMYRLLCHESPALDMYHSSTRYCLFPDKLVSVLKSYKRLSCPQRHTAYPSPTKRQLNPPCACLGPSACTCHSPRSTWVRRSLPSIVSTFLR